jgi:hypothetical protein
VLRGELLAKQATLNIPPTPTPNKEALQATGTVAVDLSLAVQTTAFLQAEAAQPAAILVMSPAEQVLVDLLPAYPIGVLFRVASRRTNPDRPNLLQARLVDL